MQQDPHDNVSSYRVKPSSATQNLWAALYYPSRVGTVQAHCPVNKGLYYILTVDISMRKII